MRFTILREGSQYKNPAGYWRKYNTKTIAAVSTANMSPAKTTLSIIRSASRFLAQVEQPRELGSIGLPQSRQGMRFIKLPFQNWSTGITPRSQRMQ